MPEKKVSLIQHHIKSTPYLSDEWQLVLDFSHWLQSYDWNIHNVHGPKQSKITGHLPLLVDGRGL